MHLLADNIALIGMAGAGKSTIGPKLAARCGLTYLDTDHLIEDAHHCSLQEVLDQHGIDGFQRIEEQTLLRLDGQGLVIATGGSVIYSTQAMEHLRSMAQVLWLDVSLAAIEQRVHNQDCRGLVSRGGETLADLYAERYPLYLRYAHHRICCTDLTPDQIVERICRVLGSPDS
jgi:shikimate kinase